MKPILALLVIALLALGFSVRLAASSRQGASEAATAVTTPLKGSETIIVGAGIIEPLSEEIRIGTPVGGVVTEVLVKEGDEVTSGAPLFRLDDRELAALLLTRRAEVAEAQATLDRLRALPRPESVEIATAATREARATLELAVKREARLRDLRTSSAASQEAYDQAVANLESARARLQSAEADLELERQGAWAPDLRLAESTVQVLHRRVEQTRVDLERLTIRAPRDCTILNVNLRAGEYVPTTSDGTALLIVGQARPLVVRVDIDETELWRFPPQSRATIFARGNPRVSSPASYLEAEPRVVPKVSLTGARAERVDIRVFQVRFRVEDQTGAFRFGQQVDVHIEALPPSTD